MLHRGSNINSSETHFGDPTPKISLKYEQEAKSTPLADIAKISVFSTRPGEKIERYGCYTYIQQNGPGKQPCGENLPFFVICSAVRVAFVTCLGCKGHGAGLVP